MTARISDLTKREIQHAEYKGGQLFCTIFKSGAEIAGQIFSIDGLDSFLESYKAWEEELPVVAGAIREDLQGVYLDEIE